MAGMCRGSQGRHGEVKKEPMAMVTWGKRGDAASWREDALKDSNIR